MELRGAPRQRDGPRTEAALHRKREPRELAAGGGEDFTRDRVFARGLRHHDREAADLAAVAPMDEFAGVLPLGAADRLEERSCHRRAAPMAGLLVLDAPDVAQRLAGDPEAAAAVIQEPAAAAGAMEGTIGIDERRHGSGARVHEETVSRLEEVEISDLYVGREAHRGSRQ